MSKIPPDSRQFMEIHLDNSGLICFRQKSEENLDRVMCLYRFTRLDGLGLKRYFVDIRIKSIFQLCPRSIYRSSSQALDFSKMVVAVLAAFKSS